jgi:nitroimidazol reductase NimA-like FMN-containing flavoprotein (pyridoxamine 5'-phosphate oxidase superfamily)
MAETKETWRGKVRAMKPEEIEEFLGLGVNMYLACLSPDGSPYITVCWHEWKDGYFWVIPRQHSRWADYLASDSRVSFVVEQPKNLGKVLGQGHAELVERPNIGGEWVPIATRMSYRYLGENGPTYLESTMKQPRWLFRIKPTRFETWQGVGWARRYWVEDTGGPTYEEAHASV